MTEETPPPPKAVYRPPPDQPNPDEPARWLNLLPVALTGPIHWLIAGPQRLLEAESPENVQHERTTRDIALNSLDRVYELAPPDENAETLRAVWKQRSKFCLYLRSYDFATRVVGTAVPEVAPPFGETIAVHPMHDIRLRKLIEKAVGVAPLISVVSPLDVPTSIGQFRYHESEWRLRVQELITAAQVIVMYLRGEESGVAEEIQMIRRARREQNTILVLGDKDVFSTVRTLGTENAVECTDARWDQKREARSERPSSPPDGFPLVLAHDRQDFEGAFTELIARLLNVDTHREFSVNVPLPALPLLSTEEMQRVIKHGIDVVNRARTFLANNHLLSAEASFQAAWAFFYAVGATRHRASVSLELGRFYLVTVGEANRAVERLRESARLYRRLNVPAMLMDASQELTLACLAIEPPALDEARRAVEEAERLLEVDRSPWNGFTVAHARESVERSAGNSTAAAEARAAALLYYGEYRAAGGSAPTPEVQWLTDIGNAFLKAGRPDAHTFLSHNPTLAQLPRFRQSLLGVVGGSESRETLLANAANAAVQWELSKFIDILIGRTNGT